MITLLGFMLMILALGLVIVYCPDLATPLPAAFYFTFTACIWIYSTFDNCDGKQARRTGTSSPLGELFDHGCDALNCWMLGLVELASLTMGTGALSCVFMLIFFWGFYLPTWETYHTGVLYLGYINAPTEGVIFGCVLILLSAFYGPEIYHKPVAVSFPNVAWPSWMAQHSLQIVASAGAIGSCVIGLIPLSLWAVWKECRAQKRSFLKALSQLSFMVFTSFSAYTWLWCPYTRARQDHFILFHVAVGLAFGKMATKIILAHLTKQPFPEASGLMTPLFLGALLFNTVPRLMPWITPDQLAAFERIYLWAFLVIAVVGYANWIYHVISSFCTFLDINCLTIKKRKVDMQTLPRTPVKVKPVFSEAMLEAVRNSERASASPYKTRHRAP